MNQSNWLAKRRNQSWKGLRAQISFLPQPAMLHMIVHMKQILVEVEPEVAEKLERIAPGRSRRRSEFIRMAIQKALWELEEAATAQAYREAPDSADDAYVDPDVWEGAKASKAKAGRRR